MITVIRNADFVVAWDDEKGGHKYLRNTDVAFNPQGIIFVGKDYDGPFEKEISGTGRMVMPGLVNIHAHPGMESFNKGLMEERGSPRLGMSSLYEYMPLVRADKNATRAAAFYAFAEMIKSGITTITDYAPLREGWLDDLTSTGLRACVAPMYRSGRWLTRNGHSVEYEWDEAAGWEAMVAALEVIDKAAEQPSGRLFGMVAPAQIDTCSEELILESAEAARKRNISVQIHAAQSMPEFHEMVRRHGMTPVEWLDEIGFLYDGAIIGHCIFVDEHSWTRWPYKGDLERVRRAGTSVAHCPTIFSRRGITLEDFGKYRRLGINVGLGTDTFPHNFVEEMRTATILNKVVRGNVHATNLSEVFHAATVGGAKALLRDDIGRLSKGCKADLSLVNLKHPSMQPLRDPLKSLVFTGLERPITDVFVDGTPVLEDGKLKTIDLDAAIEEMNRGQNDALKRIPSLDYAGRPVNELFPMTLEEG